LNVHYCVLFSSRVRVTIMVRISGGSKNFEKGETIYQLRPHLSQMRTTKYIHFTRKNGFLEKNMSQWGGAPPHRPSSFNPPLVRIRFRVMVGKLICTRICASLGCNCDGQAINGKREQNEWS